MTSRQGYFSLRLPKCGIGPQARNNVDRLRRAITQISCRVLAQRCVDIRFVAVAPESGRCDADNCVLLLFENDRTPQRVSPAVEVALPETVAQYRSGCRANPVLLGQESTALR